LNAEENLRAIAKRPSSFTGADKETTGPIGYLIGAAYALLEATRLGYVKGDIDDQRYSDELRQIASALSTHSAPELVVGVRVFESERRELPAIWLAGFFFNSALHRIAAGAERLGVHPTKGDTAEPEVIAAVHRDVNKLKHLMTDRPSQGAKGLLVAREVESILAATSALEALVAVAESKGLVPSGSKH
jgi:hypothetical protein